MWNNISNFAAIIANRMVRTKLNPLDLLPLGARDESYDGNYKDAAILPKDLVAAADAQNTGYYTVDLNTTSTVNVTTPKGVIEITMDSTNAIDPAANFATSVGLTINNPDMDFSDLDKVYYQATPYYNPDQLGDTFIPYVLAVGALPGLNLEIFNASSTQIGGISGLVMTGSTTILAEADKIYTYLPTSTTGSGEGAYFTVKRNNTGAVSGIDFVNTGKNYLLSDVVFIPGNFVGGVAPTDNITFTVGQILNPNAFTGKFYLYYELYNF